jgi:hypothetical protein
VGAQEEDFVQVKIQLLRIRTWLAILELGWEKQRPLFAAAAVALLRQIASKNSIVPIFNGGVAFATDKPAHTATCV